MKLYIATTTHGLGHITRVVPVLGALRELAPTAEMVLSASVTEAWLAAQLGFTPQVIRRDHEIGVAQRNCFETDLEATLAGYRAYADVHDERLAAEKRFLADEDVTGVVVDVPSLPVRAAAELGLPVVAVSNFTWDWILEGLLGERAAREVAILRGDYARGGLHLQLPFSPPATPFPRAERAPLLARRARLSADEVRARLGLGRATRPLVVVCPGGWTAAEWPEVKVESAAAYQFVFVGDLPIRAEHAEHLPHELPGDLTLVDLIGAAAAVVAKPGYGLASECILHRTPLVATERPGFPETPILLDEVARNGRLARLTLDDFFAGRWARALEAVLAADGPWLDVPERPERIVAERILAEMDG